MKSMWRDDLPITKNPLRFFLFASNPHWRAAIAAILLATAGNAFSASVSYVFKLIGDAAASLASGGSYDAPFLGTSATARYALTSYVTLHSRTYFSDRFAGSLMNKIRHAATGMREVVDVFLWEFLELGVNAIGSFIVVFLVSPRNSHKKT